LLFEIGVVSNRGVFYKGCCRVFDVFQESGLQGSKRMAKENQLLARMSQELLDELTAGGTRDLRQVTLSQMEREVYEAADQVSQRVMRGMLEDQAAQADQPCCPRCQSPLEDRPPGEDEPMQLQRFPVQWKKAVKRCPKCRRDFFPSGEDVGLPGGGDVQPGGGTQSGSRFDRRPLL